jgi:hypothetical protein
MELEKRWISHCDARKHRDLPLFALQQVGNHFASRKGRCIIQTVQKFGVDYA